MTGQPYETNFVYIGLVLAIGQTYVCSASRDSRSLKREPRTNNQHLQNPCSFTTSMEFGRLMVMKLGMFVFLFSSVSHIFGDPLRIHWPLSHCSSMHRLWGELCLLWPRGLNGSIYVMCAFLLQPTIQWIDDMYWLLCTLPRIPSVYKWLIK